MVLCGCMSGPEVEGDVEALARKICVPEAAAKVAVERRFDETCRQATPSDQAPGAIMCVDTVNTVRHMIVHWVGPMRAHTLKVDVYSCFDDGACYLEFVLDCGCSACAWSS